ncbi:hypothetical protein BDV09DRAFT_160824 [Aspergillus tetrazonus]
MRAGLVACAVYVVVLVMIAHYCLQMDGPAGMRSVRLKAELVVRVSLEAEYRVCSVVADWRWAQWIAGRQTEVRIEEKGWSR